MQQAKFDIGFAHFAYGGNGGISSETPDIREWQVPLVCELARDPRVGAIRIFNISDTPITMSRNQAILKAREMGVDILVMVDSDMRPDVCAGQPDAKPFFQTSFDYIVEHYHKGPVVIGAPYCGPPPNECVYVFRWQNRQSNHPDPDFQLEMYDRHTAVKMAGIQECAALPTGLIMFDMRCFDLIEPQTAADKPFAYYEWSDKYAAHKASTEDVTMTRDLSLAGATKLGYNPVLCNWDAWAGHWKPKCVGKPVVMDAAGIGEKLKMVWDSGHDNSNKIVNLTAPKDLQDKFAGVFDGMGMELIPQDVHALENLIGDFRREFGRGPTVLEIGSWAGRSAIVMATAGAQSVHCVDHWRGNAFDDGTKQYDGSRGLPHEVFKRNTAGLPITSTCGESPMVAEKFEDASFDIVYIDAEHTYDAVLRDIGAWAPKARHWVCGHDYHAFQGVRQAVDEMCGFIQVEGNVWRCDAENVHPVQEVVS